MDEYDPGRQSVHNDDDVAPAAMERIRAKGRISKHGSESWDGDIGPWLQSIDGPPLIVNRVLGVGAG